jgi:hypothetical protein
VAILSSLLLYAVELRRGASRKASDTTDSDEQRIDLRAEARRYDYAIIEL